MAVAGAAADKFCLKWNDFQSNVSTAFQELREGGDFFDVTLACEDQQLEGHKVILSACSPFFRALLRRHPHQHPLLYMKGVRHADMLAVLNFMYHGEVNIAQAELSTFLAVAEELQVKGLTKGPDPATPSPAKRSPEAPPSHRAPKARRLASPTLPPPFEPVPEVEQEEEQEEEVVRDIKTEQEQGLGEGREMAVVDYEGEEQGRFGMADYHYQEEMAQALAEGTVGNDRNVLLKYIKKIANNTGYGEDQFKCEICGKTGTRKDNVLNHVENTHFPGTFDYRCKVCTKTMPTKKSLENHVYRNHSKDQQGEAVELQTQYVS